MLLPALSIGQIVQTGDPFSRLERPSDNSPYSRFGLGDIVDQNHSAVFNLGSLTAAYHDKYNVNILNPASLPYLQATSFEVGVHAKNNRLTEGSINYNSWNGSLSYFSLAFPLSNPINDLLDRVDRKYKFGMSVSLQPFTTVGYDILTIDSVDPIHGIERNYIGNGGTYNAMWGTGLKVKNFSAGFNIGYLFGKIGTNKTVTFTNLVNPYNNYERVNTHITGFVYNVGFQYELILNKEEVKDNESPKSLTFGIYGNSSTNFKSSTDELFLAIRNELPVFDTPIDTIIHVFEREGSGKLPSKLGIGVMYNSADIWGIGFNYELQGWSNYTNEENPIDLQDAFKLSVGGFYTPKPVYSLNYFERIQYKAGVFYNKEPFTVDGQDVDAFGFTFGLGLPFVNSRKVSNANIGATLGARGLETAIEERYLRLNFGFTFNSNEWFIKRKYN